MPTLAMLEGRSCSGLGGGPLGFSLPPEGSLFGLGPFGGGDMEPPTMERMVRSAFGRISKNEVALVGANALVQGSDVARATLRANDEKFMFDVEMASD